MVYISGMDFVTQIIKRLEKYENMQVYRWHPDNGLLWEIDTFQLYYLAKGKTKNKSIQPMMTLSERQLGWMEQYDGPHVGSDDVTSTFYVQLSF